MLTSHSQPRFEEIDALRGVAATVVVIDHIRTFYAEPHPTWWVRTTQSPLGMLQDGPDAVFLFFIMSGFVLFLPYLRQARLDSYPRFLVKRICRIYLPYLAALIVAIVADLYCYRPIGYLFPEWANWTRPFPVYEIWYHLALVWRASMNGFNPAFWSLAQEMRISIAFPIVAWIARGRSLLVGLLLGLALTMGGFYVAGRFDSYELRTIGYAGLFVMGAAIAQNLAQVYSMVETRAPAWRLVLFVLAYFLIKATHLLPTAYYQWWTLVPLHGMGELIIMVLALTTVHFRRLLLSRPLQWVGKVSYSLYLIHGILLYSLVSLFWRHTTHHLPLLLAGGVASFPLAGLFYHWVERPSIILGRYLTRGKHPRPTPTPTL